MLNTSDIKPANYHTMSSGNIVEALIRKTLLEDAIPTHAESALTRTKSTNRRKTRVTRSTKERGNDQSKLKRDRGRNLKENSPNGVSDASEAANAPTVKRFKKAEQHRTGINDALNRNGIVPEKNGNPVSGNGCKVEVAGEGWMTKGAMDTALANGKHVLVKDSGKSLVDESPSGSGNKTCESRGNHRGNECSSKEVLHAEVRSPETPSTGNGSKKEPRGSSNMSQQLSVTNRNRQMPDITLGNGKVKTVGMSISNMIEQTLDLVVTSALKSDEDEPTSQPKPEPSSSACVQESVRNDTKRENGENPMSTPGEAKGANVSSTTDCNSATKTAHKPREQTRSVPHVGPKKKVLALLNQFSMDQILSSSAPPPTTKEHPKKSLLWRAVEECAANSKVSSTNEAVSRANGDSRADDVSRANDNGATKPLSCAVSCSSGSPGLELPLSSPDNSGNNSGASDTGAISPTEGASSTSSGSKDKKKKRKRCGVCAPCSTKQNCGECSSCKNRRTGHQICKQRKCIELRKKLTDPCQPLPSVATISAEGVSKMKQAAMSNAAMAGYPPGMMPNIEGKLHPATSMADNSWVLQASQPVNGFLPHFNNLSQHIDLERPRGIKMEEPHMNLKMQEHHIKREASLHPQKAVKPPEGTPPRISHQTVPEMRHQAPPEMPPHSHVDHKTATLDGQPDVGGRPPVDGRQSSECQKTSSGRGLNPGERASLEERAVLEGFRDLNQLHQYWSLAAQRVPSPHASEEQIMLHHQRVNSGNGVTPTNRVPMGVHPNHHQQHLSKSSNQYSPHPKAPNNSAAASAMTHTEILRNNISSSSHHPDIRSDGPPQPPRVLREAYPSQHHSPHPSPQQSPHPSPHLPPRPQRVMSHEAAYPNVHPPEAPTPHESYSPVDLAAESLLSLSGLAPKKGFSFPTHMKDPSSPERQKQSTSSSSHSKKDATTSRGQNLSVPRPPSSPSPFTKVSQINKLATPEGYALLSNLAHTGPSTLTSRPPQPKGLQPGEQITTPSPKVHVLPTHMSSVGSSSSHSAIPRHMMNSSRGMDPALGETSPHPGCKTPERQTGSPISVATPLTPEEVEEQRIQMLTNNERLLPPKCGCLEHDMDEAPYYVHLGAGPSVPAIRKLMEERFGHSGNCIRIEKVVYSGKEGKSSRGCPIAKWIIRRSSDEEKILTLIRNRPGHHCDTAYIVIAIVAWEGVEAKAADYLYDLLRTTLPFRAIPTLRKCATNEEKTCACQGFDSETCGASFTFGCSWSMYYNACKFARSKTPRKFKLLDSDSNLEETLEAHFQHLAGEIGPLYKKLAPDSYSNQVAFEEDAKDCRLGHAEGRPFSGVTACMDFCAHAHRDQQNMNNGSTVVVTLTKESIRKTRPKPGDEQLHILPLYYLDSTDEHGSSEGQQEKVRNGSLEVLTAYRHKSRLRQKPVVPKGAVRFRSGGDKSSPAKASKTVANLLASKSSDEKKKVPPADSNSSLPVSCPSDPSRTTENTKDLKKSSRSAFASPKESNSPWPQIKQEFGSQGVDPRWPNEMMNGTGVGLIPGGGHHQSNYQLHHQNAAAAMNGLRPEAMMNSIPQEYMSPHLYPGLSPYIPAGYPGLPPMNGMITPEQLQANPHLAQLIPQYAAMATAAVAMDPSAYLNPFMRVPPQHYPPGMLPHGMEHVDVKPDPKQLDEMMRHSFGKAFAMQMGALDRNTPSVELDQKYSRILEHRQSLNGPCSTDSLGHHPSNVPSPQDAIWRPPIFQSSQSPSMGDSRTSTPINAMEQSVNSLPMTPHQQLRREHVASAPSSGSSKNIPGAHHQQGPRFIPTTPLKCEDSDPPCDSPEPQEEEYFSDSERCFEDPTIGGLAVGLGHGAVLFEVAKRELHATSSLGTPCRQNPTRISLVFYQHKQLNYKHHGLEFYEKKVEAKRQLMMEEGKVPPKKGHKRAASSDEGGKAAKEQKTEKAGTPTMHAVTPHTYTMVTVGSYAPTKVTGPYQSPQGKAAQQSKTPTETAKTPAGSSKKSTGTSKSGTAKASGTSKSTSGNAKKPSKEPATSSSSNT